MELTKAFRSIFETENDMTALDLRTSLESPAIPLNSPQAFSMVFGGEPTAAGEVITEHNALTISTVYACVRLIAESLATFPLKIYEQQDNGRREATDHTLSYLLGCQPNPEMAAFTFLETIAGCAALTGNAYAEIVCDSKRTVTGLYPLHPLKTTPVRDASGAIVYETSDGMQDGRTRIIQAKNIIHVPLFGWDGLMGLSPIQQARQTLGLSVATLKQGARFFGNGSRPGGLLAPKAPITPTQGKQMIEFWETQSSGVNQGRIAFIPADWNYTQLGLSLQDSQFLESRAFSRTEIAALFRVPAHMVGDTSRLSNANHEQSSLSLLQDTLQPYLVKIEQELMRKLLPPTGRVQSKFFIRFDVQERLRTDLKTLSDSLSQQHLSGFITANEGRKQLGLNPVGSEGDVLINPVNTINAKIFENWNPQKPSRKE
jgi:HK97 family phage portal protein